MLALSQHAVEVKIRIFTGFLGHHSGFPVLLLMTEVSGGFREAVLPTVTSVCSCTYRAEGVGGGGGLGANCTEVGRGQPSYYMQKGAGLDPCLGIHSFGRQWIFMGGRCGSDADKNIT